MVRKVDSDLRCRDCGVDTDDIDEDYMVTDTVRDQATRSEINGHLCIGCLEHRLGRPLRANDFTNRYINTTDQLRRSPRLTDRLQDREV